MTAQTRSTPRDRIGILIAWLVILVCTAWIVARVFRDGKERDQRIADAAAGLAEAPDNPQLMMVAKYGFGAHSFAQSMGQPTPPNLSAELRQSAKTRDDRLRLLPLVAELEGKPAAIAELDRLYPDVNPATQPASPPATIPTTAPATSAASAPTLPATRTAPSPLARALRAIYTDGPASLSEDDRSLVAGRLGWTGRLALTHGASADNADRQVLVAESVRFMAVFIGVIIGGLGAGLVGVVLLILAITWWNNGKLRLRYVQVAVPAPASVTHAPGELPLPWLQYGGGALPPALPMTYPLPTARIEPSPVPGAVSGPVGEAQGRTAPFLESFAIYIAGMVFVPLLVRQFIDNGSIAWNLVTIVPVIFALFWPRMCGIRGGDFRRGFGWTAPRGALREIASGAVGYVAGLPVFFFGLIVSLVLVHVFKASPTHPIVDEAGGNLWQTLLLYGLAAVWAPVVEETFFRGALFHHLRKAWGWIISASLSSLIFAAIHPQGWALIPGLMSLAIVFCGIREWRGGTIGGMVAHAIHNGTLVTLLVLAAG